MEQIKILFVEDISTDVELAIRELENQEIKFKYEVVCNEIDFRNTITTFIPDLIISDYAMPTFDGMAALKITRSIDTYIPFIVLTGSMNEQTAVLCMKAGADDYVIKEKLKRLPFAVKEVISKNEAVKEKDRLKEQLKLLSSAVEQSSASILITNAIGNIVYVNPGFEKISGYTFEEVKGKNPRFMKSGFHSPEFYKNIWDTITSGNNWTGEIKNKKKNGELYWLKSTISPILDKNKKISHFIAVREDITEKIEIINKLIEAKDKAEESDRLKSAFLANMSHEIRTPMNGILGFTSLLLEPDLTSEKKSKYIEVIHKSGQRMLSTVSDIIEISKIEAGMISIHKTAVNISEMIQELFHFFETECLKKNLKLSIVNTISTDEEILFTDSKKIESIITNLIKNSIKYTEKGFIKIECSVKNGMFNFHVEDSGVGIPKNKLKAIFNRFEQADIEDTRNYQGSGLGLAISKSYAEKLGGKIWVKSEKDVGSTFYFTIPLVNEVSNLPKRIKNKFSNTKTKIKNNNVKILIVEDDSASYYYLSTLFNEFTSSIIHRENGLEAIDYMKNNLDVDLILMDLKMPVMDGIEATKNIRMFNKNVLILAQSAYAFETDKEIAINAGCNDYITKPINKDLLFEKINTLLAENKKK